MIRDVDATRVKVGKLVEALRKPAVLQVTCTVVMAGGCDYDFRMTFDEPRERILVNDEFVIQLSRVRTRLRDAWVQGRWLSECPLGCGRSAAVLWPVRRHEDVMLVCGACARVSFISRGMDELGRARLALRRLRGRLGLSPPFMGLERRPHQRQKTFLKHVAQLKAAESRVRTARLKKQARWKALPAQA